VFLVPYCRLSSYTLGVCLLAPLSSAQPAREALDKLRRGNQEFAAGHIDTSNLAVGKDKTSSRPIAAILSCSDSIIPPEFIFGQGSGDLFVVRVSGAVASQAVAGSLEYATEQLGARLIVVMGHTSCGAVKATLDGQAPKPGMKPSTLNMQGVLNFIRPALERPQEREDPWTSAVYSSVEQTIDDLVQHSQVISEMARGGQLGLVGAVYRAETGKVVFSKPISFSNIKPEPMIPPQRPLAIAHGGE